MLVSGPTHLRTRLLLGLVAASVAGTARASAQRPDSALDSGRVVRLHTAAEVLEARLIRPLSATSSTVEFCKWDWSPCGASNAHPSIPAGEVLHIDIRRYYSGRGALIGAVFGVVAGYAVGRDFEENECDTQCGASGTLAALGGLVFAGVGAILGALFSHWVPFR